MIWAFYIISLQMRVGIGFNFEFMSKISGGIAQQHTQKSKRLLKKTQMNIAEPKSNPTSSEANRANGAIASTIPIHPWYGVEVGDHHHLMMPASCWVYMGVSKMSPIARSAQTVAAAARWSGRASTDRKIAPSPSRVSWGPAGAWLRHRISVSWPEANQLAS